jgi:hypothetical protein
MRTQFIESNSGREIMNVETEPPKIVVGVHAQSNGFPVLQRWVVDSLGVGGYAWMRLPIDFIGVTAEDISAAARTD